jgi:glycosyltransferase involved in cell wall biosynthesis
MLKRDDGILLDVIVRTMNSAKSIESCLQSICDEVPVRNIILVDGGSKDDTIKIASRFDNVSVHVKPDLNLGKATKYGFSQAGTEWVAVIDSDVILRKGWFESMKENLHNSDAVEGCRIDHYSFDIQSDCTKTDYPRFGQTLIKRLPVLEVDLDLPFGEDVAIKNYFDMHGKVWKKVPNFLADHYTKIESSKQTRTGIIFKSEPHVLHIPKQIQIEEGHMARRYGTMTKKKVIKRLLLPPIYEAYWSFKKNFWFTLAYFKLK